jgi:geranylgeranyl pyrophosphate synthase
MTMKTLTSLTNLNTFLDRIYSRAEASLNHPQFDPTQRALLVETLTLFRSNNIHNPIGDLLSIFYRIAKAWDRTIDEQAEHLGTYCLLYIISADLIDDVQDEDLAGKPHAEAGPAIAINSGLTLLFVGLDHLRQALALETSSERQLQYLEIFNHYSVLAVSGQHQDLMGAAGAQTCTDVLAMQQAKTSSIAMVIECAALFAQCNPETTRLYRSIGGQLVQFMQIIGDIYDIFGKRVSPDLATQKMTYPIACFLELASPEERLQFDLLRNTLPNSLTAIRRLFYDSGAIAQVAETIERLRVGIHTDLAATGNASAAHQTWLYFIDNLASGLYTIEPVEASRFIQQPENEWNQEIKQLAAQFRINMAAYHPPATPDLLPWFAPEWMYVPKRQVVYYPDLEGQPEEILPEMAVAIGTEDLDLVLQRLKNHAKFVMAHELFHHWRDMSGNLTEDAWYEEWAAFRLLIAYTQTFHADELQEGLALIEQILAKHQSALSDRAQAILESFFAPNYQPQPGAHSYGVNLDEVGLIQLAMARRLCDEGLSLDQEFAQLLPNQNIHQSHQTQEVPATIHTEEHSRGEWHSPSIM